MKDYFTKEQQQVILTAISELEIAPIVRDDLTEEFLNETLEAVKIGNLEYAAGRALKVLDPIAFNEEVNNHMDHLVSDEQALEINNKYYWMSDLEDAAAGI